MPKSQIIRDFINRKIGLEQALERLMVIAMEIGDSDLLMWVKNEKNGYARGDVIPDYRMIAVLPVGDFQQTCLGTIYRYTNHALPTIGVPESERERFNNYPYMSSVSAIKSQIEMYDEEQIIGIPISPESYYMFEEGTNIEITRASLSISIFSLKRIIETVRSRIIELLVCLEKNFGNLDDLDVEFEELNLTEIEKLREKCAMIINGKEKGDTFVIINSKIKKSNIANDSSFNKKKASKISSNVKVDFPNKKSIFERIIKFFGGRKNG